MPAFQFTALQTNGDTRKGVVEADTARAARSQLRGQGLVPLDVAQVSGSITGAGNATPRSFLGVQLGAARSFNAMALMVWTRQLAGLISSGLPLERALTALLDEAQSDAQRATVASLRAEVNAGNSFAKALAQHNSFSDIYQSVIAAGEQSGQLSVVLDNLANDLETQQDLRSKLLGAALYPAIVSLIALVIVIFLLTYVVPQVTEVFAHSRRALPFLTVAMLGLSHVLRNWAWLLFLIVVAGASALHFNLRRIAFKERFDAAWLELPLIGRLSRGYNAARFSATLAMLAGAGVPILRALQTAAMTLSNSAMRADAMQALVQVREGAGLGQALAQRQRFPSLLIMFARLGEQTGELPTMLERAALQLGNDVQRRAMQLATILEPLLVVVMGMVVMLIVLAVLLPIIQMNQLMN